MSTDHATVEHFGYVEGALGRKQCLPADPALHDIYRSAYAAGRATRPAQARAVPVPTRRLTEAEAATVRRLYGRTTARALAEQFGVSERAIHALVAGQTHQPAQQKPAGTERAWCPQCGRAVVGGACTGYVCGWTAGGKRGAA